MPEVVADTSALLYLYRLMRLIGYKSSLSKSQLACGWAPLVPGMGADSSIAPVSIASRYELSQMLGYFQKNSGKLKTMPIIPEFIALIDRLNQELDRTEARATKGVELARELLARFPNNAALIQYFAYLNAALLFIETSRKQIQSVVEAVRPTDIPLEIVQERGETLSNLLGKVLETKLRVEEFVAYLER